MSGEGRSERLEEGGEEGKIDAYTYRLARAARAYRARIMAHV
jgi:hypothetical protein